METRLKEARKMRGYTLKQVAELIHTSESAVSKFEHGARPSEQSLVLFCDKLGINRHWLETGEGEMLRQENDMEWIATLTDSPIIKRAVENLMRLDAPRQKMFLDFLDAAVAHSDSADNP